jgi:hypothetical protein
LRIMDALNTKVVPHKGPGPKDARTLFACGDQRGALLGVPGGGVIRLLPEGFAALFLPAEILPASLLTPPVLLLPVVLLPARPVVVPFMEELLVLPLAEDPPAAELPLVPCANAKGPVTASAAARMIVAGFMVSFLA